MYEVWRITAGTAQLIDTRRDPDDAQTSAVEQSLIDDSTPFAVMRQGFGVPLYFVWRGITGDALDIMRRMSIPDPAPPPRPLPPVTVAVNGDELDGMSVSELRTIARDLGIAGRSTMDHDALVEAIRAADKQPGPSELKARDKSGPSIVKQFGATVTGIDEDEGIVDAIVNVFGIVDDGADVVHLGAFAKTLAENGSRIRVLDSHNNRSALSVVGRPLEIREIGRDELPPPVLARYPNATGGLFTRTKYLLDTPEGAGVFKRIKAGALNEYSIGFDALDTDNEKVTDPDTGKPAVVRHIRSVRLWEYSPVVFGMNPATATVSVKAKDGAPDDQKPYTVVSENDEYCVYKVDEDGQRVGESLGCHASESDALDQIAALYAAEDEDGKAADSPAEVKAGRVLNERNFQAIKQAAELLNSVLASAGLNDGDEDEKPKSRCTDDDQNGPSVSTDAPTPSNGAGPQDDGTPANEHVALDELKRRLAQLEA